MIRSIRPLRLAAASTVAGVAVGALALASANPSSAQTGTGSANATAPRTITVTGVGRVSDRPDTVTVFIGVETSANRAKDALTANSQAATKVIDLLKARGVVSADIQTSNLSINPRYDNNGRRVTATR